MINLNELTQNEISISTKIFLCYKKKERKSFLTREILQLMVFYLYRYIYIYIVLFFVCLEITTLND